MYSHIRVELIVLSMQINLCAVTEKKNFLAYKLNDPLQFYSLSCFHLQSINKLFVAFPWVVTSTGPGRFMVCHRKSA